MKKGQMPVTACLGCLHLVGYMETSKLRLFLATTNDAEICLSKDFSL